MSGRPKTLDLAAPIASLRAATGLSQTELARRLGAASRGTVYAAERNGDGVQISTLIRYAAAAGGHIEIRFVAGAALTKAAG